VISSYSSSAVLSPESMLESVELWRMVDNTLTIRERDVVRMRLIDGLTFESIGEELGCGTRRSPVCGQTARYIYNKALHRLRAIIKVGPPLAFLARRERLPSPKFVAFRDHAVWELPRQR